MKPWAPCSFALRRFRCIKNNCLTWDQVDFDNQVLVIRKHKSRPDYIKLCDIQKCYRARLTPKQPFSRGWPPADSLDWP